MTVYENIKKLETVGQLSANSLVNADCLEAMKYIADKSIDCIIADLPYGQFGTTACKWDTVIPFEPLWGQYKRIIKDNGAIVLFGCEPFSSLLRISNLGLYKYDWIWEKPNGSDPFQCGKRPMNNIENISIFYNQQPVYNPQMTDSKTYKRKGGTKEIEIFGCVKDSSYESDKRYPMRILKYNKAGQAGSNEDRAKNSFHPTQKPVPLLEYLIKTYTNENEVVLDNCAGSFTTAIAAINTNRKCICIEKDDKYFEIGKKRVEEALSVIKNTPITQSLFP